MACSRCAKVRQYLPERVRKALEEIERQRAEVRKQRKRERK